MWQVRVGVTNLTYVLINYVGLEDRQSDLHADILEPVPLNLTCRMPFQVK